VRRLIITIALTSASLVFGFVLMEGFSSAILASWQYWSGHGRLAETRYTRYDPELGWISEPNVLIPDMYGEGAYLRTDSRGFRDDVVVYNSVRRVRAYGYVNTLLWYWDRKYRPALVDVR